MKKQSNLLLALSLVLLFLTVLLPEALAQTEVKFTEPKKANTQDTEEKPYTYVNQMPEFEGGEQAYMKFITSNLKYPADGSAGTSFVSFIVEKDGSLSNIEVVKGATPALDQEAVRVLKLTSGKWKPGKQNGKTVRVKMVQPVEFAASK